MSDDLVARGLEIAVVFIAGKSITVDCGEDWLHKLVKFNLVDVHVVDRWVEDGVGLELSEWVHLVSLIWRGSEVGDGNW